MIILGINETSHDASVSLIKDGTSRVQTVTREQHPGLYRVLNKFYLQTGVPILLNTSLNIKGQPLLNDERDILLWEETYNFPICKGVK
jgi:carbamoyltransferase